MRPDPTAFKRQALAKTLSQFERREMHDPDFRAFLNWTGAPVRTILDVGANRGQSLACLLVAFPNAIVHCFEANPIFFEVLGEVAQNLEGRCVVHPFGLGRDTGRLTLFVPWVGDDPYLEESSTIASYFEKPWVVQKFAERGTLMLEQHVVDIHRGDELALRPQLVKIDVEGAESDVVAGLGETIRAARPMLLVENSDWHGVTASLARFGYQAYRYESTDNRLVPFYGATTNCFYFLQEHLSGFGIE